MSSETLEIRWFGRTPVPGDTVTRIFEAVSGIRPEREPARTDHEEQGPFRRDLLGELLPRYLDAGLRPLLQSAERASYPEWLCARFC